MKKTVGIGIGIFIVVVVGIGGVIAYRSSRSSNLAPQQPVVIRTDDMQPVNSGVAPLLDGQVPEADRIVRISLEDVSTNGTPNQKRIRVNLESTALVNVATVALQFNQTALKLVEKDFTDSVFPMQIREENTATGWKATRSVPGAEGGLFGKGVFGVFIFEILDSNPRENTVVAVNDSESVASMNDGYGTQGVIVSN